MARQYALAQIVVWPREDMVAGTFGVGLKETPEAKAPIQFLREEQATCKRLHAEQGKRHER